MDKQQIEQVYTFIRNFIMTRDYPPLRDEIAQNCNLTMPQVADAIERLNAQGRIYGNARPPYPLRLSTTWFAHHDTRKGR